MFLCISTYTETSMYSNGNHNLEQTIKQSPDNTLHIFQKKKIFMKNVKLSPMIEKNVYQNIHYACKH